MTMKNQIQASGRNDDGGDGESTYREKIAELMVKHFAYFDQIAWPKTDTEAWTDMIDTWVEAFGFRHISPRRLEKAIRQIRENPPQFKQDHLPRLLELVDEYKRQERSAEDVAKARDIRSGPCSYCEDNGYVLIFRRDYVGEEVTYKDGRRIYLRIVAPCICRQGRLIFSELVSKRVACVDIAVMPKDWSFDEPRNVIAYPNGG